MKIQVKQEHIDKGKPDNCKDCPVAIATIEALTKVQSELSKFKCAFVYPFAIWIGFESYNTPDIVVDFIRLFDNENSRHLCTPFEFELELI